MRIKVNKNQYISCTLLKPRKLKEKNPALIFLHGWSSNQQGNILRAKELTELGFICLTLDLRGDGNSEGSLEEFSREDHLQDIKAAYKYLSELKDVDSDRIGLIGSSYTGYLSSVTTNSLKLKWLVLRVPALYFDEKMDVSTFKLIQEDKKAFTSSDLTDQNSLALKGIRNFPGEILLVESEKDEIIPHSTIENYLKYLKGKNNFEYVIIKNAKHSLDSETQQKEYIEILRKWFSENL